VRSIALTVAIWLRSRHGWVPRQGTFQVPLSSIGVTLAPKAPCRLQGCKNRLAQFPDQMLYKATKPGLVSDWLERLLWRSLTAARGSSPESPGQRVRMIFLIYCIASLFYYVFVLSPAPTWYNYFSTFMAWYSLFVLKVPLNLKQTNKYRIDSAATWWLVCMQLAKTTSFSRGLYVCIT